MTPKASYAQWYYLVTDGTEVAPAVSVVAGLAAAVELAGVGNLEVVQVTATAGAFCCASLPDMTSPTLQKEGYNVPHTLGEG